VANESRVYSAPFQVGEVLGIEDIGTVLGRRLARLVQVLGLNSEALTL